MTNCAGIVLSNDCVSIFQSVETGAEILTHKRSHFIVETNGNLKAKFVHYVAPEPEMIRVHIPNKRNVHTQFSYRDLQWFASAQQLRVSFSPAIQRKCVGCTVRELCHIKGKSETGNQFALSLPSLKFPYCDVALRLQLLANQRLPVPQH